MIIKRNLFSSIRGKLVVSFFTVITVLVVAIAAIEVVNLVIIGQFRQVTSNIFKEFSLIDTTSDIVAQFNVVRNNPSDESIASFERLKSNIVKDLDFLESSIQDPQTRTAFIGAKNTITSITSELDEGVQQMERGDLIGTAEKYSEANRKLSFVNDAVEQLILADIRVANKLQVAVEQRNTIVLFFLIVFLGVLLLGCGIYVVSFSKRLIGPLHQLADASEVVAKGDFNVKLDATLLHRKDEVGSLANSFHLMIQKIHGFIDQLKAINDKVEQEKKIAEAQSARDEALLESVGEGLIFLNNQGQIVSFNAAAEQMLGFSEKEVLNKKMVEVLPMELEDGSKVSAEEHIGSIVMTSTKKISTTLLSESHYFKRKNDTRFLPLLTATPVVLDEKIVGSILIFHDATKEKEVDRMKTEFLSLASHQLRTPLSAIKWFTEMMLDGDAGKLKPEQLEFTKNISESTERMIQLVNSLLNISRIESGRIIVDPVPTDLGKLINSIITELEVKTKEKKQQLIASVHESLPTLLIDPNLIRQVYLNLLTNAIKYTPEGGSIEVLVSNDGNDVISQVTDTGYGIPESEYDKVFSKFYRGANIVKFETDGTGLGLYLVKAIVESSGGKIWFKSKKDKGTSFWFTIPLKGMKSKKGEVSITS